MGSAGAAFAPRDVTCSASVNDDDEPDHLLLRFDLDLDFGLVFRQVAVVVGRDLDRRALARRGR